MKHNVKPALLLLGYLLTTGSAFAQDASRAPAAAQIPPFEDMLAYVYIHNPELDSERDNVKVADEKVSQAVSGYRPSASVDAGAGRQREKIAGQQWQYGQDTNASLNAVQPIFNGFGTLAQRRAADQRVLAARSRLLAVEQNVLLTAIMSWLDVCEKEKILVLTEDNLHRLYKYDDASRQRFKAGDGTQTDIAQSESRLAQAEARMAQAEADRDSARATFERVTGMTPPAISFPPPPAGLPHNADETQSMALNNPELMQASYQQKAAEEDIESAKSSLWPTVSLRGSMSQEHDPVLGLNKLRDDSISLNISIPLYQGGAEYSRVREAKILREKSRYDSIDTGRAVKERALLSWNNYRAARAVIDASGRASAASGRALGGVAEEQKQGLRTLTDVLDEQSELLSTQIIEAQAEKTLRLEAYRLMAAIGRLTAEGLNLQAERHDPEAHYKKVAGRWAGF